MINSRHFVLGVVVCCLFIISCFLRAEAPLEGPPQSGSSLSKHQRVLMPIARTFVIDAAMYGGLVIIWPDAFAPRHGSTDQFGESFSRPPYMNNNKVFFELDDDPWVINGVLHTIYGSEVYMAARTIGHNGAISFLYALGASLTWEYLVEGWFHRPSGIDLVWTPFAGAVFGELRYQLVRLISRRMAQSVPRTIFITLLDPLGQLERALLHCQLDCHR